MIELCDSALTEDVSITRDEALVSFRIEQEKHEEVKVFPTEFTPLSTGRTVTSSQRARIPDVMAEVKALCDDLESVDLSFIQPPAKREIPPKLLPPKSAAPSKPVTIDKQSSKREE